MSQKSNYTLINDNVNIEEAKQFANIGIEKGKIFASQKYLELKKYAEEGGYTWKVLGLFAGGLMVINGLFSFLGDLTGLSPLMAVLNIYLVIFGVVSILLEYKDQTLTKRFLEYIKREAHFLYIPHGRGAFYVFCGSLLFAKGGIVSMLMGLAVTIVGVILYYSNKNAYEALAKMKEEQFDDQKIAALFQKHDKDNDGCLTASELATLCQELGSPLDYNALESAVLVLDTDGDNQIQYREFISWYKGTV